jgi:hypothetical protein
MSIGHLRIFVPRRCFSGRRGFSFQSHAVAIIPARAPKPQDKAKVRTRCSVVQRGIVACLCNRVFHSLNELNVAIGELLDEGRSD